MNKSLLIGLTTQLGSKVVTVADIAKQFAMTPAEIQKKSGITKLHLLADNENIIDMTVACAKRVLYHNNVRIDQIDGIFGSSNPTMETLIPTYTVQVAKKLGLKNVIADHIGLGCCGGLQALRNAHNQLLATGGYYLVVVADQTSRILDNKNLATSVLFSEGCAVLLLTSDETLYDGFHIHTIHTKSLLIDEVSLDVIRLRNPYVERNKLPLIEMDGATIYKFGVTVLDHILACAGTSVADFKSMHNYLIPHQPNLRMLHAIMKNYNLTEQQMYIDGIKTIGNTSGPAVFFGLHDALSRGLFNINHPIILGAFGAELQVGGATLYPHRNPRKIIV
jgi:3-oxoacyl-[acyl-carrier-protein] synthase-3